MRQSFQDLRTSIMLAELSDELLPLFGLLWKLSRHIQDILLNYPSLFLGDKANQARTPIEDSVSAISSVGEPYLDTVGVTSSNLVSRTTKLQVRGLNASDLFHYQP